MSRATNTDWPKIIKALPKGLTIAQVAKRIQRSPYVTRYHLLAHGYAYSNGRKVAWTPEKRQAQGYRRWGKAIQWEKMKWKKYADFQIADFIRNYYGFSVTDMAVRKARKIYGNGKLKK